MSIMTPSALRYCDPREGFPSGKNKLPGYGRKLAQEPAFVIRQHMLWQRPGNSFFHILCMEYSKYTAIV